MQVVDTPEVISASEGSGPDLAPDGTPVGERNGGMPEGHAPSGVRVFLRLWPWGGALLIFSLFVLFLHARFAPAISAPDANGYWAQGSRMAVKGQTWFVPETDPEYVGMHWLVTERGRYHSRYPAGLPVVIAVWYRLFGAEASVLVNPFLSLVALLGFWLLLRVHVGGVWALCGLAVLAGTPSFMRHALTCDSHMAVTALLIWGILLLTLWSRQGHLWQAALSGLILGCIPTVRYPEVLFAVGAGVFLLCHLRRRRWWLHVGVAVLGALIPIVPLLVYNHLAFGAFWRTAYALSNEQTGFGWGYLGDHFIQYVRTIQGEGVGPFFGVGIVGAVAMFGMRKMRAFCILLALLVVPTTLLYMAYYWGPEGHSAATMRFVLPTFPCYIAAGVCALDYLFRTSGPMLNSAVAVVLVVLQVLWGTIHAVSDSARDAHTRECLAVITRGLAEAADSGDVVMGRQSILQHLDFVQRWKLADIGVLDGRGGRMRRMPGELDSDTPSPRQAEKAKIESAKYAGMTDQEREDAVAQDLRAWAGEGRVLFVGTEEELAAVGRRPFSRRQFRVLAHVALPESPPEREPSRWGGRPGRGGGPGPPPMAGVPPQQRGGMMVPGGFPPAGMGGRGPGRMMGGRRRLRGGMFANFAGIEDVVVAEWVWRPTLTSRSGDVSH